MRPALPFSRVRAAAIPFPAAAAVFSVRSQYPCFGNPYVLLAAGGSPYLQNGGRGNARLVNDTIALIVANGGSGRGALGKPSRRLGGNQF